MAVKRIMTIWKQHTLGNYLKYNTFYQDTHHYRNPEILRQHQFRSDHFEYDDAQ